MFSLFPCFPYSIDFSAAQQTFTCLRLTIETQEKGVKYAQS